MNLSLSLSLTSVAATGKGGVVYEAEAVALFARFTTPPDTARKGLINDAIKSLKTAGVWAKLDALYLFAAADNQAARRNWIADQYNVTAVASPVFTADRGYQGDGAASYLRTGFNASTAVSPKFVQNSAAYAVWLRSSATGIARIAMGANTTIYTLLEFASNNTLFTSVNGANGATVNLAAAAGLAGLWAANRSGANALKVLRNGVQQATDTDASSGVANTEFFILARSSNGTAAGFSADQVSASFIASSLSDAEHLAIYNALNTYLQAVGAV